MEVIIEYGVETTLYFPLIDFGATDFESTPVTFASGDTQISKDGGAFGNTTNNPTHIGNGVYSWTITATEAQAKRIAITIIDQTATKEWEDQAIIAATRNNASAAIEAIDANAIQISGDATAADNLELDYDGTGYNKSNSTIGTCTTNTDMRGTDSAYTGTPPTAAAIADAVLDEALSGHTTAGTAGKALSDIDTNVAALPDAAAIAQEILRRDISANDDEDNAAIASLTNVILHFASKIDGTTGAVYKMDGTTVFATRTPTTDASADPVTSLGVGS